MANSRQATANGSKVDAAVTKQLIYRQSVWTRVTHWVWAICLFFLLLTGLQIFNAHPTLYIGQQSGFEFDNSIFAIYAENTPDGPRGYTEIFGKKIDTTGTLGLVGEGSRVQPIGFPGWATIPSNRDLATGRVVHFFFAWIFVGTLFVWLLASLINRHAWRDVVPKGRDLRSIGSDIVAHIKFKFDHGRSYSPLQKLSYFGVLFVLFPLMILTGLSMSPGMNAAWPWLLEVFGGRQTARTIHFIVMLLLVGFFVIHMVMVIAAGPINEMRSMITGWYRTNTPDEEKTDV